MYFVQSARLDVSLKVSCSHWRLQKLQIDDGKPLAKLFVLNLSFMTGSQVCILSVVMMSLFLYAALLPYKTMRFNLTECTLLATAALMTGIVSGLTLDGCCCIQGVSAYRFCAKSICA